MMWDRAIVMRAHSGPGSTMKYYSAGAGNFANRRGHTPSGNVTVDYPHWQQERQLYNLTKDPIEQTDLTGVAALSALVAEAEGLLSAHWNRTVYHTATWKPGSKHAHLAKARAQ